MEAPLTLFINLIKRDLRLLSLRIGFLEFFLKRLLKILLKY
jgi:hypothetical protein